jgi:hypothetical protein
MRTLAQLLIGIPALAAGALWAEDAAAYAYTYGGFGCSGPAYISGHRMLTPHCSGGGTVSLNFPGLQADIAESAWRQWWHLDTTNPAVWISRTGACTLAGLNGGDDINQAWLHDMSFNAGQTVYSYNCGFFGAPDIQKMDIEVFTGNPDGYSNCRNPTFTEDGTWVHEIGHDYGYAHFDDWLSSMNTSQPDVTSCRSDRRVRPSSDSQQQHANRYGLPAAVDLGGSPLIQTCALTGAGCASSPGSTTFIAPLAVPPTVNRTIQFTSMNMRDAVPGGSYRVRLLLSADDVVNAGDNNVGDWTIFDTFPGAIYPYSLPVSFNASLIPVGTTKCVLVQWDPLSSVAEHDESDNVTDTRYCFTRL